MNLNSLVDYSFWKLQRAQFIHTMRTKKKTFLIFLFSTFLVLQQLAVWYGRNHRSHSVESGYDKLAFTEINDLEALWHSVPVEKLLTPTAFANQSELESFQCRLKAFEKEIQVREEQNSHLKGKRRDFYEKVYGYYHNSAQVLLSIVNFLLSKENEYEVYKNEVNFELESNAECFKELLNQLYYLEEEKKDLDEFIRDHNANVTNANT